MQSNDTTTGPQQHVGSTAELGGLLGRNSLRPKIRGQELTLHLALHILRNPFPFDQRERDLVRLWAADELERLSVRCMQSNTN